MYAHRLAAARHSRWCGRAAAQQGSGSPAQTPPNKLQGATNQHAAGSNGPACYRQQRPSKLQAANDPACCSTPAQRKRTAVHQHFRHGVVAKGSGISGPVPPHMHLALKKAAARTAVHQHFRHGVVAQEGQRLKAQVVQRGVVHRQRLVHVVCAATVECSRKQKWALHHSMCSTGPWQALHHPARQRRCSKQVTLPPSNSRICIYARPNHRTLQQVEQQTHRPCW